MKQIEEYPNYFVTKDGRILSTYRGKFGHKNEFPEKELAQVFDKSCGYMLVTLCGDSGKRQNKRVHRLMVEAFIPNPENHPQVNHKDGDKLNNILDNLEWCTAQRNSQHAVDLGLCDARREKAEVGVIQYTKDGVFVAEHVSLHQAGRDTGIAWQNISKVVRNIRPFAGGFRWEYK